MLRLLIAAAFLSSACSSTPTRTAAAPTANPPQAFAGVPQAAGGTGLMLKDMAGVGHSVDASLEAGRPVALIFWQTWCGPCKRESPELIRASRELAGKVDFFGIVPGSDEDVDAAEVQQVARAWGLPYPQVRDRDLALTERFGVQGTPDIVVLGSGGRILYRGHESPSDWSALL